ncbi:hypothetical protein VKT23_015487 [Stygiomarasmius scandens]|uniref:Heterokaryon incompatibility domain-containing protein n=1 Tax=Marasmiellus scandens TaxID=2682957 RepID=A0ABR1J0A8_9AGAR
MRLLNTKTLQVAEFYTDIPPYAILSHTWGKEEVTFQDIQILETAKTKAGWSKIEGACTYASKHHFDWIWIDSCCINKESSAELSEAINSMYQYYLDGSVCYVYLSDARKEEDLTSLKSTFRQSRWFTRGWTLQELLAPTYIVFLDKNWTEIGTRWSLRDIISAITRIPRHVFEDGNIHKYSIAQKMSWAAQRCTTRPEDQAYCLIGIFGISMSPIYGEGCAKAFMRLQQEIIKISDDRSIFAWIAAEEEKDDRGLLARSPYEFRASGDIRMLSEWELPATISSFSFNNNGLHIHMPQLTYAESHPGLFLAPLLCQSDSDNKYLSIYLKRTARGRYVRSRPSEIYLDSSISTHMTFSEVVVKQDQPTQRSRYTSMNQTLVQFSPRCAPPAHSNAPYSHRCASLDDKIYGYYPSTERVDRYTMNKYTSPASEYFAIVTWRCQFTVVTDKSRKIDHFLKNEFTLPSRQDRLRTCLPSGEVLSVALDITGTLAAYQRKEYIQLELSTNILPSGVPNIYTSLTKQIEPSPNWGFLVDLSSLRSSEFIHTIFTSI